jgi:hypothetical protein
MQTHKRSNRNADFQAVQTVVRRCIDASEHLAPNIRKTYKRGFAVSLTDRSHNLADAVYASN